MLAVSKYAPGEAVEVLAAVGQIHFAESRPQALRDRAEKFPDLQWHMIGPVQKNKAKYIGRHAALWHSVEDAGVAQVVAAHVEDRRLPVLLQVDFSQAASRHGVSPEKLDALFEDVSAISQLEVAGLMCMAPLKENPVSCFSRLRRLRDELFGGSEAHLSMGMSGDFRQAVAEGATLIRLGGCLFDPEQDCV